MIGRLLQSSVLRWAALVAVLALHLVVMVASLLRARLDGDSAYNLSVPINLISGHGYSSFGVLSNGTYDLFDPRITTGPAVLLPIAAVLKTGIDPVVGARLVMLAFYVALLVVLYRYGRRLIGPWGGVVGLAALLSFDAAMATPVVTLQGPSDVLGEYPTALFLLLAIVLVRHHVKLSGLMFGLAVSTKLLAALSAPAILIAVVLTGIAINRRDSIRRVVVFGASAAVPLVGFEVVKLFVLGPHGYLEWVRHFRGFFNYAPTRTSSQTKLTGLEDAWFVPMAAAWLILGVCVAVLAIVMSRRRHDPELARWWDESDRGIVWLTSVVGLATWIGWWLSATGNELWLRTVGPPIFVYYPLIIALTTAAVVAMRPSRVRVTSLVTLFVVATSLVLSYQGLSKARLAWDPAQVKYRLPVAEKLSDQRAVADAVRAHHPTVLYGPWTPVAGIGVLAGVPPRGDWYHMEPGGLVLVSKLDASYGGRQRLTAKIFGECARVVYSDARYTLCEPKFPWPGYKPVAKRNYLLP